MVEETPVLELMAPVALNVVCFRYAPEGASNLDELNQELLLRLQESGRAVISSTRIGGRFALRVANVNHRSTDEDMDELLRAVTEIGEELR
jgi:glutamate/tyrosine decarboxylase-like PLP-dependent enzyme